MDANEIKQAAEQARITTLPPGAEFHAKGPVDTAQIALLTIAQAAAGTLTKALPAIDLSSIPLADRLEFLVDLSRAKQVLDGFGIQQKTKSSTQEVTAYLETREGGEPQ